jgi:stage II sporulation protein P
VYILISKQHILKLVIIAALAVMLVVVGFLFIRWLYLDNSSEAALTVFTDYGQSTDNPSKYSGNLYINIINSTIPAARVSYESRYGQTLPSFASSAYSKMFSGMNFDIKNPRTYFSFVFTAFSQYDEEGNTLAMTQGKDDKVPLITNFDEAPEGAIYFSEEEEYSAEEAANPNGLPVEGDLANAETNYANISDPARLEIEKKEPSILLLHTHSMETYSPFSDNNYHSSNNKQNVTQVGTIMTDVLESKYKYNVIHDITKHDNPSYADSYINSQKTIISQLGKNPSVKVVLDVHRDALAAKTEKDKANIKSKYTTIINGKSAAKVEFVIGPDNKNYAELQKFVVYVKKKMDKLYPGLFYNTVVKSKGKYNQFYRDHTLLIEVGCTFNTDKEAKYSAELMGNVIGEVLKDLEK